VHVSRCPQPPPRPPPASIHVNPVSVLVQGSRSRAAKAALLLLGRNICTDAIEDKTRSDDVSSTVDNFVILVVGAVIFCSFSCELFMPITFFLQKYGEEPVFILSVKRDRENNEE
jgi:hypothetical protein